MRTKLGLSPLCTLDCTVMMLVDTSVYNTDLPVECPYLDITPPGYINPVRVVYTPNTSIQINTVNLGLSTTPGNLPSGVYKIRQSIKPNTEMFKEYHVLYTLPERKKLAACVNTNACNCDDDTELSLIYTGLLMAEELTYFEDPIKGEKVFKALCVRLNEICSCV